jgi:hypothetical protein
MSLVIEALSTRSFAGSFMGVTGNTRRAISALGGPQVRPGQRRVPRASLDERGAHAGVNRPDASRSSTREWI